MDNLFSPKLDVRYKDVSYETIHDPKFRDALLSKLPRDVVDKLFSEHDAAPEARQ